MNQKYIFANSLFAFVSAFAITTILHESGHFISYYLLGAHPALHHNYVQVSDKNLSTLIVVISALAGPVTSMVQAFVFGLFVTKKGGNDAKHLLFLWLSLLGAVNFFGYLMLTPFTNIGDTGRVAELLTLSDFIQLMIALFGIVFLILFVLKIGKYFANFIPQNSEKPLKGRYIRALLMYPIITGSLINAVLALPVVAALSLIYPVTSPYVNLTAYGKIRHTETNVNKTSPLESKFNGNLILITALCVILNRILALGVS